MKRAFFLTLGSVFALLAACSDDPADPAQEVPITGPTPDAGTDSGAVTTLPARGELELSTADTLATYALRTTSLHARVKGGAGPYRLAWTQTSGPAVTLRGDATLSATFDAPSVSGPTDLGFSLLVVDALGTIVGATTKVTVNPNGLLATVPAKVRVGDGQTVTLNAGIAGSLDGASFQWRQTAGPELTIATPFAANASVTIPALAAATTYAFELAVTSRDGTFTRSVSVDALPGGKDTEGTALAAFAGATDLHTNPGSTVALNGTARNATAPTYAWAQIGGAPTVTLSAPTAANPTFVAPAVTLDAQLVFELTVTDGASTAKSQVTVNVKAPDAFALGASAAPAIAAGATTYPTAGATGGEGPYRWLWTQKSGPAVTIDGATTAAPRVVLPYVAEDSPVVLTVEARDGASTKSQDVTFTILAPTQSANGPENAGATYRPLTDAERTGFACTGLDCFTQGREVVCDERAPFPITVLTTAGQGKVTITKRCTSGTGCLVEWAQQTRSFDICLGVLPPSSAGADSIANNGSSASCSYCCYGEGCNKDIIPVPATIPACEGGVCYPTK